MTAPEHTDSWAVRAWVNVAAIGAGSLIGAIILAVLGWALLLVDQAAAAAPLTVAAVWLVLAGTALTVVGGVAATVVELHRRRGDGR